MQICLQCQKKTNFPRAYVCVCTGFVSYGVIWSDRGFIGSGRGVTVICIFPNK